MKRPARLLKRLLQRIPYVKEIYEENLLFQKNCAFYPGHYYSVIVSVDEVRKRQNDIWCHAGEDGVAGIDLKAGDQLSLLGALGAYYGELPFRADRQEGLRYHFRNDYFSFTDGILLYSMIRHFRPKKIIEIGSGFSSALMLDTNELFCQREIDLRFIEPHPERLYSLMKKEDERPASVMERDVQSIPLHFFESLNRGDFLFIDSSHVVKTGSDVNYILFEILPKLKPGVFVHFHDIFYPFEYPKNWVLEGRNWNEDYFLRAFLMYNRQFEIRLFASYLHLFHGHAFSALPLCTENAGSSLWLEKK